MMPRMIALTALLLSLSACVATPRIEIPDTLDFSTPQPVVLTPLSFNDVLCCYQCSA